MEVNFVDSNELNADPEHLDSDLKECWKLLEGQGLSACLYNPYFLGTATTTADVEHDFPTVFVGDISPEANWLNHPESDLKTDNGGCQRIESQSQNIAFGSPEPSSFFTSFTSSSSNYADTSGSFSDVRSSSESSFSSHNKNRSRSVSSSSELTTDLPLYSPTSNTDSWRVAGNEKLSCLTHPVCHSEDDRNVLDRKEKRKAQNRTAAAKFRNRKKLVQQEMEESYRQLELENEKMRREKASLEATTNLMEKLLTGHLCGLQCQLGATCSSQSH